MRQISIRLPCLRFLANPIHQVISSREVVEMKSVYRLLFAICVAFPFTGLVWAQEPPRVNVLVGKELDEYQFQRLVDFKPNSAEPFIVNPAVADDLIKEDNELADAQLKKIKQDIEDLITKHPESLAAKEMAEVLDKAELRIVPQYGICSKYVFFSTVPIYR